MTAGKVFHIQRFCTDDGDGIRTVVFLKGCPLKCLWCHNPESQSPKAQISYNSDLCLHCGACVGVCPQGCHSLTPGGHHFNRAACTACGACADICSAGVLELAGTTYTVEEILALVLRDKPYYGDHGGLTLSGGEPLMQGQFAVALAEAAKDQGINVCVETSGACAADILQQMAGYADCFLFDYKCHPDDYKTYTGTDFAPIERSLSYLSARQKRIVLRCPIVPGCIRPDHFQRIGQLAEKYGISHVELLPYHDLGISKCQRFGIAPQQQFAAITKAELQEKAQYIRNRYRISAIVR